MHRFSPSPSRRARRARSRSADAPRTARCSRPMRPTELHDYDIAVANYAKALREQPGDREARLGLERAKLRAAEAHLARGRRLIAMGRYEDAVLELQIASDLNPTNGDAERDLRSARAAVRTKLAAPAEGQDGARRRCWTACATPRRPATSCRTSSSATQLTTGTQATSREVYLTIARMANLSVTFDQAFRDAAAPVSLLSDMTVQAGARRRREEHRHLLPGHGPQRDHRHSRHAGRSAANTRRRPSGSSTFRTRTSRKRWTRCAS